MLIISSDAMMSESVLVDTSYLYALYNLQDTNHPAALEFARNSILISIVPDVVLPEVCYLFMRDIGHHIIPVFLDSLVASEAVLASLLNDDIKRATEIMRTYADAQFDVVDCCLMALAERLSITQICSFDRRDFSIFRPHHCDYLQLSP
jgi:predicted nucleic acid-binding protein